MKIKTTIIILFFWKILSTADMTAQTQAWLGISGSLNLLTDISSMSEIGISYEARGLENVGFETGYYQKKYVFDDLYLNITYSSIPMYLKFFSKQLNFAIGLNVDVLSSIVTFSDHFDDSNLNNFYPILVGINLKMSKDFIITNNINIEPEVLFNYNSNDISFIFGAGFKLKYNLKKQP
jgi:hypothetical protein